LLIKQLDGCLWDLRSGRLINKFDKITGDKISGVFHPTSPEVIINGEIWDLRANRLLKIVPELKNVWPRFSPQSTVILSALWYGDTDFDDDDENDGQECGSQVEILDSRSY